MHFEGRLWQFTAGVRGRIAGSAAMYGYMLRPIGPVLRIILATAAIVGLAYVFNHQLIVLV